MGKINKVEKIAYIDNKGVHSVNPSWLHNKELMINDIISTNSDLKRNNVLLEEEKENLLKAVKIYEITNFVLSLGIVALVYFYVM
jgi:uncharacterized membrane protein YqjE